MAIAGKGGSLWTGATPTKMGEVADWSLDVGASAIDTTALDSTWATKIGGIPSFSGSANANLNMADAQQSAMFTAITTGAAINGEFRLSDSHKFSGSLIVTGFKVAAAVADKVTLALTFEGNGALTYA